MADTQTVYDAIIIGSGPAGCTAAIYTSRAYLNTLVVAGFEAGGQLMLTSDVENFPGYPEGIGGPEMMAELRAQAERFGSEFIEEDADEVDFTDGNGPHKVTTMSGTYTARTVIIATGSSAKWLGIESEQRLMGRGVSACATCDGFFFKDKEVVVVGGGDTAMEEATFLTKYASKVTIVHRRDEFRASKIMAKRAMEHPKIEIQWNRQVKEVLGEDKVEGVLLESTTGEKELKVPCEGFFMAIGHKPNTDLVRGQLHLDEAGYIVPEGANQTRTNVPGVFVAGDVFDHRYKQAVTAAGSGCKAAIDAERWLEEHA